MSADNNDSPKPKKRKRNQRSIDWDWNKLRDEWLSSGLSKTDFFKTKGLKITNGNVYRNTKTWVSDLKAAHEKVSQAYIASIGNKEVPQIVAAAIDPHAQAWQDILRWRAEQCKTDYRLADSVRAHVKMILMANVSKKIDPETGQSVPVSTLTPGDVAHIARAVEKIQKIQRLAMGMSTENVGVDAPIPKDPDKPAATDEFDDGTPRFRVIMSKAGKFTSLRPRQVTK